MARKTREIEREEMSTRGIYIADLEHGKEKVSMSSLVH